MLTRGVRLIGIDERRWASRLQQDVKSWSGQRSIQSHCVQTDGVGAVPVIVKRARGANRPTQA
jgi:hypothetical protein